MADNYGSVLQIKALQGTFARISKVYPTLANGITLTTAATTWGLGNFTEIVPANTITKDFRIDTISFAAFSVATTYEVVLYKGASGDEEEIGRMRVHPGASSGVAINLFHSRLIPANTRITARVANNTTNANTVVASIGYHEEE